MLTTIIILAAMAQAPTSTVEPAPRVQAARPTSRDFSDVLARKRALKAKKNAMVAAGKARERNEASSAAIAAREQQALYERMLPFMLEQQRQQLERMSAMERNNALQRMARAAEADAATYQWQVWKSR